VKISKIINTLKNPKKFAKAVLGKSANLIANARNRQREITLGNENPGLAFYIIGFNCGWNGLAWIILHIIEHLEYADEKGYTPVIDLQNFNTQYTSDESLGTENVWEYWFEHPAKYGLGDIAKSKLAIKSKKAIFPHKKYSIDHFDYKNAARMEKLQTICNKYIKINEKTREMILEIQNRLIGDKKVLGIMCRGTDFSKLKPYHHPIQPDPLNVIEEAETIMAKHNCSHIFLSTEDKDIYDLFHKKFGNNLLSVQQTRFSVNDIDGQNPLANLSAPENRKKTAFSYLASMYILSKCPCFMSGITGGSLAVKIMGGNFEYERFWDLGTYPDAPLSDYWKIFREELSGKRAIR
jgi:hypothetical protein